jgi:hypothetical protein
MEWIVMAECYAAMAAFRAAEPGRFAGETGIAPERLGAGEQAWRRGCRMLGAVLLAVAFGLAWAGTDLFRASMLVSSAAMVGGIALTLLAPVARRGVWVVAAACLTVAPVATVVSVAMGGA